MKILKLSVLPILVLLSMTSCEVQEVELVAVENIELVKMQNNILLFNVSATLDNPNSFNIKMMDSDLDLYLANSLMGKAHLLSPIKIKKKTKETYSFQIQTDVIDHGKLLPILLQTALTGKVKVGVKGDVTGKVSFLSKKIKVNMEDVISIKDDLLKKK